MLYNLIQLYIFRYLFFLEIILLYRTSQVALVAKNLPANADLRDMGSILGLRRCPGGGNSNPL